MSLLRRLLGRQEPQASTCPKCGAPTPAGATECSVCGWDLHELYAGERPRRAWD